MTMGLYLMIMGLRSSVKRSSVSHMTVLDTSNNALSLLCLVIFGKDPMAVPFLMGFMISAIPIIY